MASTGNTGNPELSALEVELDKLGVPKGYYSLGQERNERTCVLKEGVDWIVFFSEHGRREDVHRFSSFIEVKKYVLSVLQG